MAGWKAWRRQLERRYLREVLARHSSVVEAAQASGHNRSHLYKRLEVIGLQIGHITPPRPRLTLDPLPPWKEYFRTQARAYWDALLATHTVMTHVAAAAQLNRTDLYKHLRRAGLSPAAIREQQGRKSYGGNAAWRSLADSEYMAAVTGGEPMAAVRRLPRPADPGPTGASRHG